MEVIVTVHYIEMLPNRRGGLDLRSSTISALMGGSYDSYWQRIREHTSYQELLRAQLKQNEKKKQIKRKLIKLVNLYKTLMR